jgi:Cu2+-exporting ATPase
MSDPEHKVEHTPADKPTQDEVASKSDHPEHKDQHKKDHKDHQNHHAHMAADFRNRFWISLALTLPILALSPLLQSLVGMREASPGYLREQNIELADDRIEPLQAQDKTVVFILVDGQLKGAMALADIIRPEAKQAIEALKALDIRCMMLTGDNQATAKWVSDQIGLDEYFAEVLPQDKAAKVKEVQARGTLVAMTGDGVNDAPALAQADVGIAIGAGSDVAVETADIVLVRSNPMDVVAIVQLSRATYTKMIQNLFWATGYNVVAIPLAAGALFAWGVLLTPALGAALMSVSTVIVAINARLLKIQSNPQEKGREQG